MTVKSGVLKDPNTGTVKIVNGEGQEFSGEIVGYGNGFEYFQLRNGSGTELVENPVSLDVKDSSLYFEKLDHQDVENFPYSGRDYVASEADDVFETLQDRGFSEKTPEVTQWQDGYVIVEGNSYFTALEDALERMDGRAFGESTWFRISDYSREESLDIFLEGHILGDLKELRERRESDSWYSDEEIEETIRSITDDFGTIDPGELENLYRIEYNIDRLGMDVPEWYWSS